jgi:hypothetical protein
MVSSGTLAVIAAIEFLCTDLVAIGDGDGRRRALVLGIGALIAASSLAASGGHGGVERRDSLGFGGGAQHPGNDHRGRDGTFRVRRRGLSPTDRVAASKHQVPGRYFPFFLRRQGHA